MIDQTGVRLQKRLPVVVVPDFGCIIMSVPSATGLGATIIFAPEQSQIATNDFIIPLQHVGCGSGIYTFNIEQGKVEHRMRR